MSRSLLRPCLGCGRQVRGKPRCAECQRDHDRPKDQAKRARRPDLHSDAAERERRRRAVATHRATVGDWCPGLEDHPAHPSADLVADHVVEVAIGGLESGPLRVLCRGENGRRSARSFDIVLNRDPSPGERPITHRDDNLGPVVA
jgi:5-methylcytosine-specific restriction protein A